MTKLFENKFIDGFLISSLIANSPSDQTEPSLFQVCLQEMSATRTRPFKALSALDWYLKCKAEEARRERPDEKFNLVVETAGWSRLGGAARTRSAVCTVQ